MKLLPKLEGIAAILSFAMIFVCGLLGHAAAAAGMNPDTAGKLTRLGVLLFFFIFAFSCIGLMIHVFVVLQTRIGNAAVPMVRFLADHEAGVTFAFWGFLGLGTLIALPFVLRDLVGLQVPVGGSNGVLVADIGMTLDEAKRRSTLKMNEPRLMGDGSHLGVETKVFDFQICDSSVCFSAVPLFPDGNRQGRYAHHCLEYWNHAAQDAEARYGSFPAKAVIATLRGWMDARTYLAKDEETVRMWSGSRTAGDAAIGPRETRC